MPQQALAGEFLFCREHSRHAKESPRVMIGAMTEAIAVGGDFWVLEKPEVRVPGEFKAEVGKKSEARLDAGLVDAAVAEARKINEMHVADAKSRQIMSQLDAQAASVAGVLPGDGRRLNFGKSMASAAADMIMPPGTYGAKAVAHGWRGGGVAVVRRRSREVGSAADVAAVGSAGAGATVAAVRVSAAVGADERRRDR